MKAKEIKWQREETLWSLGAIIIPNHCRYKKDTKKAKTYFIPTTNAQAKFILANFNPKQEIALNYYGVKTLESFLNEYRLHGNYSYIEDRDIAVLTNKNVYTKALQRMIKKIY